jgi:hypothetical protein
MSEALQDNDVKQHFFLFVYLFNVTSPYYTSEPKNLVTSLVT